MTITIMWVFLLCNVDCNIRENELRCEVNEKIMIESHH